MNFASLLIHDKTVTYSVSAVGFFSDLVKRSLLTDLSSSNSFICLLGVLYLNNSSSLKDMII